MPLYEFEIQSCIKIKIRMETKEDARTALVERPDLFRDELSRDCMISDGVLIHEHDDCEKCDEWR